MMRWSKVWVGSLGVVATLGCVSMDMEPVVINPIARVTILGAPRTGFRATVGESFRLGVVALDSAGAVVPVDFTPVWSSSDASVGFVDQAGTVTGLIAGSAFIRASVHYNAGSYIDSLRVDFTP